MVFAPRYSSNPLVVACSRGLEVFNARHPWSQNEHFHGWILRNLPASRRAALDIGCGRGLLAERLAGQFGSVVAVDRDATMVDAAACSLRTYPNVTVRQAELLDMPAQAQFDLVTMVAVLHHLELEPTLRHVRELLAPGGRFLVVGMARLDTPRDLAVDALSWVANPLLGMVKHPERAVVSPDASADPMPMKDPRESFNEIHSVAAQVMPRARMRRQLHYRYTMLWERPQ